jgi:hypothetical protein
MVLLITSAAQAPCSQVVVSVLHVGLESVEFVCGMSSVSVMQDRVMMLTHGMPHSVTLLI